MPHLQWAGMRRLPKVPSVHDTVTQTGNHDSAFPKSSPCRMHTERFEDQTEPTSTRDRQTDNQTAGGREGERDRDRQKERERESVCERERVVLLD